MANQKQWNSSPGDLIYNFGTMLHKGKLSLESLHTWIGINHGMDASKQKKLKKHKKLILDYLSETLQSFSCAYVKGF